MNDLKSQIPNSQSLDVQIEALVLYSFASTNRHRVGEAIERELTRLFSQDGAQSLLVQDGIIEHLDGASFQIVPGAKEEAIGIQVAQAVYGVVRPQLSALARSPGGWS